MLRGVSRRVGWPITTSDRPPLNPLKRRIRARLLDRRRTEKNGSFARPCNRGCVRMTGRLTALLPVTKGKNCETLQHRHRRTLPGRWLREEYAATRNRVCTGDHGHRRTRWRPGRRGGRPNAHTRPLRRAVQERGLRPRGLHCGSQIHRRRAPLSYLREANSMG